MFSAASLTPTPTSFCFVFTFFILCRNRVLKNPIWKCLTSQPSVPWVIYVQRLETNIFMSAQFMDIEHTGQWTTVLSTVVYTNYSVSLQITRDPGTLIVREVLWRPQQFSRVSEKTSCCGKISAWNRNSKNRFPMKIIYPSSCSLRYECKVIILTVFKDSERKRNYSVVAI